MSVGVVGDGSKVGVRCCGIGLGRGCDTVGGRLCVDWGGMRCGGGWCVWG